MLTTLPRPKFAAKQAVPADTVVGVIGAGTMGAGIAEVAACGGHPVKIFDSIPEAVTRALEKVNRSLTKSVGKGRLTPGAAAEIERRIAPVTSLFGLSDAGLVIEAVIEDLDTKKHLIQDLENILSNESIIASNTSSFSITKLAAGLVYPNRVVGMHFFNPAQIMELVEVVPGLATDSATISIVLETAKAWNKVPVQTKSTPGFIVNRVARPFYAEALRLATEGSDPTAIDYVMREAGQFPMGPFELMDLIGNDVNFAVTQSVFDGFYQDPRFKPSLYQQAFVEAGFLGRKAGRGFYEYGEGSSKSEPALEAPHSRPSEVWLSAGDSLTNGLLTRLRKPFPAAGRIARADGSLLAMADQATVRLTDGRTASQVASEENQPDTVLLDLAYDYEAAKAIALAPARGCSQKAYHSAVGLFQAAGYQVATFEDVPGLAAMRTVSMLINEAADTALQKVATCADIDLAMQKGTRYPAGPFQWSRKIGLRRVHTVLQNLSAYYGEDRYRTSPLIKNSLWIGKQLDEP
ncbi:MAG TPA: 3-hydroxyacyl-CoA dehydrogenase [Chthoniobacterales bacterium]|nr:3-hydroxyacyl-CoA dehydrogenase [Chthoniobacterales bacterium]